MVIDKVTKCFLTRSDKPNENWTEETNIFIVEDGTELAQKIIANYPYFDFILDGQGNLTDITPTERPPAPTPPPTTEQQILGIQDDFDIMYAQMLMLQGVTVGV